LKNLKYLSANVVMLINKNEGFWSVKENTL
jgi:hypothetical protein